MKSNFKIGDSVVFIDQTLSLNMVSKSQVIIDLTMEGDEEFIKTTAFPDN